MKLHKYNEFVNNDVNIITIKELMEKAENNNFADREKIYNLPEYQKIIKIGIPTIPILLETLNFNNTWVKALSEITGIETDITLKTSKEISDFWKNWGEKNGYLQE